MNTARLPRASRLLLVFVGLVGLSQIAAVVVVAQHRQHTTSDVARRADEIERRLRALDGARRQERAAIHQLEHESIENAAERERLRDALIELQTRDQVPLEASDEPGGKSSACAHLVRQIGPMHYAVSRRVGDVLTTGELANTRAIKPVPEIERGTTVGVRLFGVRPGTCLYSLGVRNGDSIRKVNGVDVADSEACLEAYARLRRPTHAQVELVRGGRPATLDYDIEDP